MTSRPAPPERSSLSPPKRRWAPHEVPAAEAVRTLERELKLPTVMCTVLAARGLIDPDAAKRYLRPTLDQLHDPGMLADGRAAAARIARAIDDGETIFVHGDYDVDGICAAALYTRWFRRLGGRVAPFVPHRLRDGYDFSDAGLAASASAGATLIVTADCGTVATAPISAARARGADVIVTDHHTIGDHAAPATFLVNPQRPDCGYPHKGLCGAGVAYKVCELVADAVGVARDGLREYLDLVALATVADLVPLVDENRVIVKHGLRRFAYTRLPGITALLRVAGVDAASVGSGALGFRVAPRINAAGRVGESADALRLLLTDDFEEADTLARALDETNRIRQDEDRRTLQEALALLEETFDPTRDRAIVLARDGWHPGVIGIVASRVVEQLHRPTVLIALDGERGRGSARSIPGFHLYDALARCAGHLGRFGGHRQAAGMDIARTEVDVFRHAFNREASERLSAAQLAPTLRVDAELALADASLDLVHWLEYLGPHGIGNPRPVFLARDLILSGVRHVGKGHMKASLCAAGCPPVDAIGFGMADRFVADDLAAGARDALVRIERNEWRGVPRLQAQLVDLREAGAA